MKKVYSEIFRKYPFFAFVLSIVLVLITSSNILGQNPRIFNSSSSFTVPAGVTSITVEAWGGGGGGASAGGGGGGYASKIITVAAGNTFSVIVGTGGSAANDGENSSFGTLVVAGGGKGAANGNNPGMGGVGITGTTLYSGGRGGTYYYSGGWGAWYSGGGGGGSAFYNSDGNNGANGSSSGTGGSGGIGTGNGGRGADRDGSPAASTGAVPGGGGGGRASSGGGSGAGAGGRVIISWNPCTAPSITAQPAAQTICTGSNVTFSVAAGGTAPLSYQWRKNGANISGATNASFTLNGISAADGANYSVYVTNSCGNVTSNNALLTVSTPASIITDPAGQAKCVGQTASFGVVATGGPLTYQWQKNNVDIAGATSANYTTPALVAGDNGAPYRVIVTSAGCNSVTSAAATLTVNVPAALTTQPASQSICAGSPGTFSTTTTGTPPLSYQWKKGGVDISGETNASYSIVSVAAGDAGSYSVAITNICNVVTSNAATLTVSTPAAITTDPVSQIKCTGGSVTFSVAASGGPLTYQWRKNGSNISGANSLSFTIPTIVAGDAANYDVVVTSSGCNSVTSAIATLTVNVTPSITTPPAAQTICLGNPVTFNVSANGTALTYQWQKGGVDISGETNPSFTITSVSAGDAANYSVVVTNSCTSVTSANAVLTVNTPPSISTPPADQAVCAGQSVTFSVSATGTSPSYQWRKGGVNISGATLSSYTKAGLVPADAGSYDVVVSVNNCTSVTSPAATLTINTAPTITTQPAASQTICLGTSATFSVVAGGTPAPTYQWKKGGINISGATGSTYSIASVSATDAATYTVVVTNTCGSATSSNAILTTTTVGSWIGVTSTDWFTPTNWGCGQVPDATIDVTIPGSAPFMPNINGAGAVCRDITINGTLTITGANNLDVYGDWANNNGFAANTSSVTFKGGTGNTLAGSSATTFYNLVVSKTATANTLTSTTSVFTATNLTITQGDLILTSPPALPANISYSVTGNISVPTGGILTDNVNWDANGHLLNVGGNIVIDGIFNYTSGTPHVTMTGAGSKSVRSGSNPASGFGFLTLQTGNYSASGTLVINSNFWAMFGTAAGSFSTAGQTVTAKAGLLIHGGTVNINGGTLNITGGMVVGYPSGLSGIVNFSSGTLNADAVSVGPNTPAVNGVFNQSGGIANIDDLLINNTTTASAYVCIGSPVINITGNWTNNETFTAATSQVNLIGTAVQTIGGTAVSNFNNLNVNNATGVSLATSATVNGTLNLTNGLVTTTGVTVLTAAGTLPTYSASSYVNGKLAQIFASNVAKIYPVGKGGNYRPVTFTYVSRSGTSTVTVEQIEGSIGTPVAPAVGFTARYWNITQSGATGLNYKVTLNDPAYNPIGFAKILKREGTGANPINAFDATTPNYTNTGTPSFTTFNGTNNGTNSFALGHDCSSSANAGAALADICQYGTSAPLGGTITGTATGGIWTSSAGGTFAPSATDLNGTWTPPAAYFGTATLTLTPTGGLCTPNNADTKTIKVTQGPTGTLTASAATICAGANVTFTFPTGYGSYNFKVNGVSKQTGIVNTFSTNLLSDQDAVTVDVANSLNCGGTFGPVIITVTPLPVTSLSVTENSGTPDDNTICAGDNITFTALPTGGTNYNFKVNGVSVYSGTSNTFSSTTITNTQSVTVDVTKGCMGTSAAQVITVNPVPNGTLTANTSTSVCPNQSVTFTATGAAAGGSYQFRVDGNIQQAWSASGAFSYNFADDGVVTVDVANGPNGTGCTATYNPGIPVTVNPLPTGTIAITENSGALNNNEICLGSPVTFTFSNTGYATYVWKINGTSKPGTGHTFTTTELTSNTDIVTVDITTGSTCTAMFTAASVTIVPSPAGTLSVSPNNTICYGDNATFTVTPLDPAFNYNFKVNGISVQNGVGNNTYTTSTLAVGTYPITVDITNSSSCGITSNVITMTVNPLPTGTLIPKENYGTADDGSICAGGTVVFTAPPTGFTNYNFLLNGVSVQNGASNTFNNTDNSITLTTGDKITVALTNAGGCIGLSNQVIIIVNPLPVVSAITGTMSVCKGSTTTLSNATSGGVWASLNTAIATVNAGTGVVTGIAAGNATITYTITNITTSCGTTVTATVTVNPLPVVAPIVGNTNMCTNSSWQFTDATGGGSWSSSDGSKATVDAGGIVTTGTIIGTVVISYTTLPDLNGCTNTATYTVNINSSTVINDITGPSEVCKGSTITLIDMTAAGVWSTSDNSIATVDPSGVVTGVSVGSVTITYMVTFSCGTQSSTATVNVNALPSTTIVSGAGPFCGNTTITANNGSDGTMYFQGTNSNGTSTATPSSSQLVSTSGTYYFRAQSASGCWGPQGSAVVTINSIPAATTVSGAGTFCGTTSITASGGAGGTMYFQGTTTGGTSTALGGTPQTITTSGTYYFRSQSAAGCWGAEGSVVITINQLPALTTVSGGGTFCGSANITGSNGAEGTMYFQGTTPNGTSTAIPSSSQVISTSGTYYFRAQSASGCWGPQGSAVVTINPLPTVSEPASVCIGSTAALSPASGGTWISNNTGIATVNPGTGVITGVAAGSVTFTFTQTSTGCSSTTSAVTVNAPPPAFTLTPSSASICQGDIQSLTATGGTPTTGTVTISSGPMNVAIPDATRCGFLGFSTCPGSITTNMNVSTIPSDAFITGMSITFNVTHTYDGDLVLNLKAPNGNVLNLVKGRGGSGDDFTNTIISSTGVNPVNGGTAPFTGIYTADHINNVGTPNSDNLNFPGLYSGGNGTWTFGAEDDGLGDVGTITSWSITFNYTVPVSPLSVVWSPVSGLYTDPGATAVYSGLPASIVYSKPNTTTTYSATASNTNCSTIQTVTVTVKPTPVVTIVADYCARAGYVRLTATSIPAATSFIWSTGTTTPGGTTSSVDVDVAGDYDITAFQASGCPGSATISVANELVVNGNFEVGNVGFTTPPLGANQYQYIADGAGNNELQPEGLYGIGPDAHTYHTNFWGHDHTTGNGNFMIINGFPNGNPQPIVWQETVNVLPNTTYYFSAWGMSLNAATNYAKLQFNVNGAQVGSTAILAAGVENSSNNGWTRFYGTLLTGPSTTTATISITDLQSAPGGNDFGLDDISFATLSTFITLESAQGTDAQTVCKSSPLTTILYNVGNGGTLGPLVTGLPNGVTSVFTGDKLTINGTPTDPAGVYTYTITTRGTCNPASATGTITIQGDSIKLTSGSAAPVCKDAVMPDLVYTVGGTATGASVTAGALPAGVLGLYDAGTKTFTISGTLTAVAGAYPYTITTSSTCPGTAVSISGTITIQSPTISLNAGSNDNQPAVCINTPITNIKYTVGGTGTGATISWSPGVPTGITDTYQGGIYTIKGTPTVAGTFTYTVTTTGGSCAEVTATGTVTVTPAASIMLTAGPSTETVCTGTAIVARTYTVADATAASITSGALPAGVTGTYDIPTKTFTISGTPTVTTGGVFNYTVTTSGGCATDSKTGSITVDAQTVTLTTGNATPSVCQGAPMTPVVYTLSGFAAGATISGQPSGITGTLSGNTYTISGTTTDPAGTYPYSITTSGGSCGTATVAGTITVQAAAVPGTIATPTNTCSGSTGTLTLVGNSSNPVRWESSVTGSAPWTPIANTTISLTYSNVTSATWYRAVVSNGCGSVNSNAVLVGIHNLWTGALDDDWNNPGNWSDNQVPSTSCPVVTIPVVGNGNYPVLSTGAMATIISLDIKANASVTISSNTLQIAGSISNAGTFDVTDGTLEFNGTSQNVTGSIFKDKAIKDLIVSSGGTGLNVSNANGDTLNILESLTFGNTGADLNTGGNITLKSTIDRTASLGMLDIGNVITGDVTVERYIATGPPGAPNHGKSWQLLAVPTQGQSIKDAWQEGATATNISSPGAGTAGNPHGGYGTMLTSPLAGAVTPLGFDDRTAPGPSIKTYVAATDSYDNGPSNTANQLYNPKGYFILVRGDRGVTAFDQAATLTVLRSKGILFTPPANLPPVTNVLANKFESVGNPFASAIDMRKISKSGGVTEFYYVWDPRLGGGYNLGAFQTFAKLKLLGANDDNYYTATGGNIAGGSYGPYGTVNNFVQSGQAFLVQTFGSAGTVGFTEAAKVSGSFLFSTPNPVPQTQKTLRITLNSVSADGSTGILDGTLSQFDDSYSNAVDGMDARKFTNTGENLSIKTGGELLVIERKHTITQQDTIFLNLSHVRVQQYQFHLDAENLSAGLEAFLEDGYLNTRTPVNLNGSTDVNFSIANIAGSYAANRFRIVFAPTKALPVTITTVKAYRQASNINVEWRVDNEMNMKQYAVEKSVNGIQFTTIAVKAPAANDGSSATYMIADEHLVEGNNYYRIRTADVTGKTEYTTVVKVLVGSLKQDITIYPNPITDGMIHLQLRNEPEGKYNIRLLNKLGQLIVKKQITHAGGNSTQLLKWDYNLAHGLYLLEVTKPDGSVKNINVMY